nr:MAG TPA: hypothetical protein [Caudoviricetes sp.]
MIKPYIKNETAVEIICSICDKTRADCEPADCKWMKKLEEESVDAEPVVRCKDCQLADGIGGCPIRLSGLTSRDEALPHKGDFCSYGKRKEG